VVEGLAHSATEIESFLVRDLGMKLIEVEVKIIEDDPTFSSTMQSFGRLPPTVAPPQKDQH